MNRHEAEHNSSALFKSQFTEKLPDSLFSFVNPTTVKDPKVLLWNTPLANELGVTLNGQEAEIFSGNIIPSGTQPYATRYGGHQFGVWAGQLGDGRAIHYGDQLQLKGSGKTPYSRRGDGRAVLRSSLREYLCSEAMHFLRVPTTRALCCVTTGETVIRDMFYDGNPEPEPGAITTRYAPSFLRFGHFEILLADRDAKGMRTLLEFITSGFFPELDPKSKDLPDQFFSAVCKKTAHLMAEWLRVGFVHGVMNTDNMSLLGLTIDYGPYGWLDVYDPDFTPNTTDFERRRYRFSQQPFIAYWNLAKLANALALITENPESLSTGLREYNETFGKEYITMMGRKLGISNFGGDSDLALLKGLEEALTSAELDMTLFYRNLAKIRTTGEVETHLNFALYDGSLKTALDWAHRYLERCKEDPRTLEQSVIEMNLNNPYFILRNYIVQEALEELATGGRSKLDSIYAALKNPYQETEHNVQYFKKRPEWAKTKPGSATLSCSS